MFSKVIEPKNGPVCVSVHIHQRLNWEILCM